jgi:hypothetical protein
MFRISIHTKYFMPSSNGLSVLAIKIHIIIKEVEYFWNVYYHTNIQTGSGAHPASYPVGIGGSLAGGKEAGAWN